MRYCSYTVVGIWQNLDVLCLSFSKRMLMNEYVCYYKEKKRNAVFFCLNLHYDYDVYAMIKNDTSPFLMVHCWCDSIQKYTQVLLNHVIAKESSLLYISPKYL